MRQPKTLPLRQEGAPEGGGSVSLPQSPFLQGGVLQGRFLHFCMEDSYITDPPQYKNVRMTVFILYTRHFIFSHQRPSVIAQESMQKC